MKNTNIGHWRRRMLALIAVIVVFGLTSCKKQEPVSNSTDVSTEAPAATAVPTAIITDVPMPTPEVTPEPVTVETEDFSLTYSGLYAETVACMELMDTAEKDFEFTVIIDETSYQLFKAVVGAEDGDIVSMMESPDGEKWPVSFYMNTLPEGLVGDASSTFYIAQEVVNEVIATLTLL